ncbi:MAG: DNA repair protein [Mariniblastus sp.]|nr:DNA repair protein [Mariniblastus sp.]
MGGPSTERKQDQPAAAERGRELSRRQQELRDRIQYLNFQRRDRVKSLQQTEAKIAALEEFLGISDEVGEALDVLSQQLFSETLNILQEKLTIGLQEVLEQPIEFKATPAYKNNSAVVEFSIEKDGHSEDIYRGQGGSVQNILSVGLRLFALAQLDEQEHRRFLVLDEQDCWLKPDRVPRLVKMVHQAARELDFQIIMISHHDIGLFEKYADRIYQFRPTSDGVQVEQVDRGPYEPDGGGPG